jgi:hypothetical protein
MDTKKHKIREICEKYFFRRLIDTKKMKEKIAKHQKHTKK